MPHVEKDSDIMADAERSVELGEVEEVLLRGAVGITSVPVKASTANSGRFERGIRTFGTRRHFDLPLQTKATNHAKR